MFVRFSDNIIYYITMISRFGKPVETGTKDKSRGKISNGAKYKIQHLYLKKALKPVWEVKV